MTTLASPARTGQACALGRVETSWCQRARLASSAGARCGRRAHEVDRDERRDIGDGDSVPAFDDFYGFVGGDANQWQPNLFRNTTQIYPYYNNPGWNLVTGMADDAIE